MASLPDSAESCELPLVTMVFCSVDGGKQYVGRHRHDALDVHTELVAVMRSVLLQVGTNTSMHDLLYASIRPAGFEYSSCHTQIPGSYFVRQQDGELKYMVVFNSPQVNQWEGRGCT